MRCEEVECRHTIVGDGVEHDGHRFCTTTCKDRWIWKHEGKMEDAERIEKGLDLNAPITLAAFTPGEDSDEEECRVAIFPGILSDERKDRIAERDGFEPAPGYTKGCYHDPKDGSTLWFYAIRLLDSQEKKVWENMTKLQEIPKRGS